MELNKNVSNPLLVGSMQLMKAEDTPEHRQLYLQQLTEAELIAPARINPEPTQEEADHGRLPKEAQIQFPMIKGGDGKQFFVAYTDKQSMETAQKAGGSAPEDFQKYTVTLKIDDLIRLLLARDSKGNVSPCAGFVLNPFGENIIFPKELAADMLSHKMAAMAAAGKNGAPGKAPGEN